MLRVEGLRKVYGKTVALDDVSLTVRPGELFGFVGANGAGKTTAMRIIMGVLAADAGAVTWRGSRPNRDTLRSFGYMPEERGLYQKMKVAEHIEYFGRLYGMTGPDARRSAADWIERLGLGERRNDEVQALSLGNQQRAQLAVALVHDPQVLILDEPFSGLDPLAVDALAAVLAEKCRAGVPMTRYEGPRQAVAFLTVLALFFLIVGSASLVAMGVVEEKGSRIIEILLVAVRPWRLLAGKIAAFAVLGIIQLVVFAAAGLTAATVVGSLPELPPGTPGVLAGAFVAFLLGFAFYGAVAAALASLVSRQEEVGQVTGPMTIAIVASYLVGICALDNPEAPVGHVLSMVPPFGAMVMPVRLATADVPLWEVGVATGAMLAATTAVLVAGGRVYERAVLRTGARVKLSEAWRGSRVATGAGQ